MDLNTLITAKGSNSVKLDQTWIVPMPSYALVRLEGPDAQTFLQGQCTPDFTQLDEQAVLLGAHCTHKGRMQSSFIAAKFANGDIGLRVRADIVEPALAALKRYAVFSKVTLSHEQTYTCIGLVGKHAAKAAQRSSLSTDIGHFQCNADNTLLHHAENQYELWCSNDKLASTLKQLDVEAIQIDDNLWRLCTIRQGIGEVVLQTHEKLLPQEMNLQFTNGISFSKGCYTGQEIIARLHYRGQLKKHMYRGRVLSPSAPQAGEPVYDNGEKQKAYGIVINSSRSSESEFEILFLCDDSAVEDAHLVIDNSLLKIQSQPLPYAIS